VIQHEAHVVRVYRVLKLLLPILLAEVPFTGMPPHENLIPHQAKLGFAVVRQDVIADGDVSILVYDLPNFPGNLPPNRNTILIVHTGIESHVAVSRFSETDTGSSPITPANSTVAHAQVIGNEEVTADLNEYSRIVVISTLALTHFATIIIYVEPYPRAVIANNLAPLDLGSPGANNLKSARLPAR